MTTQDYKTRVRAIETQGTTRSDAQAIVEYESTYCKRSAECAFRALLVHSQYCSSESDDPDEQMIDLFSGLLHLSAESGYDFEDNLSIAREHFAAEWGPTS